MTSEEQNDARYPLAFDSNGNPIKVPESAVRWRVRRGGGRRGRPRNVFDAETGRQLEVPLGAQIDDLIDAGCPADRYLLYPVDSEGKLISGIVAVTEIPEGYADGDEVSVESKPDLVREMLMTLKASNDALCRALEATTSGYGPVRPSAHAPTVVEVPSGGDGGGFKPEQIAEIASVAKSMFDMFKGGAVGGGAAGGGP